MECLRTCPWPQGSSRTLLIVLDLDLDTCVLDSVTACEMYKMKPDFHSNAIACVACVACVRKRQPIGMLGRSSCNHDWLLANASACVSCGFRLRNARNASDCVWMETGLEACLRNRETWRCTITTTFNCLLAYLLTYCNMLMPFQPSSGVLSQQWLRRYVPHSCKEHGDYLLQRNFTASFELL